MKKLKWKKQLLSSDSFRADGVDYCYQIRRREKGCVLLVTKTGAYGEKYMYFRIRSAKKARLMANTMEQLILPKATKENADV